MAPPEKMVKNAGALVAFFGHWPSFHDAEVLSVKLEREQVALELILYTIAHWGTATVRGPRIAKECITILWFYGVSDLRLLDFNNQNALMGLNIEDAGDGRMKVDLLPAYGLGATFFCQEAEVVSVEPLDAENSR